ncbi:MAG: EAL domain-containing protein [Methylobacterium sp.]|uniref:putative bifunctional diguanylate cyclase/phosphodiesterase n=1 Tax=Methylobacterium sp. TaxID=409 RepID=UPI0025DAE979|nr:EAL domain-containing protein [Methylobacterium sp.]MBX9932150.1 EAL domain-containing protein [Methylobacterium sp.]
MGRDTQNLASPNMVERWRAARRVGEAIPSYEAVVLGNLGRFADQAAVVTTEGGQPGRILWGGERFIAWLGCEIRSGLSVATLSEDLRQALTEAVSQALLMGQPAVTRGDRVTDGILTSTALLACPLSNRNGEPLVLVSVADDESRYDLVKAMFGATDQGMLALSTIRDAAGAPIDFKIVALNDGAARMFGRPPGALQWQRLAMVAPLLLESGALTRLAEVIGTTARNVFELSVPRSDGSLLHLKIEAGCIGDLVALTFTDVGDLKLREESSRLLFENNPLPMWLVDPETQRFLAVNDAAVSHYGHAREAFLTMTASDLEPLPLSSSESLWLHRRADGTPITVDLFERVVDVAGRPALLTAVIDVTERRRVEARIAHMAHHDALTDLPNRVLFRHRLGEALARGQRSGEPALLFCLDLDRFKIVNDTLGHPAGDALLRGVAERLMACLGAGNMVARMGGDEFAILIAASEDQISLLAERIIASLGQPFPIEGQPVRIGVSIGVAVMPRDGADPDLLLRNADLALYRAKAAGRNTHRCFEPEMETSIRTRRNLEHELRMAFAAGQITLSYQPTHSVDDERLTGFEALLRWRHPERGFIPPSEFVPLAEESGLIGQIGEWVLRTACAEAATWPASIRLAVNLSPVQFRDGRLGAVVASALADSGLPPHRLELEITETVLLAENETNLATLHALRSLGVRIAMDDFGTGYSSLSYLRSFPFDRIKIDRSFVAELDTSPHCAAIVRAVIGLGTSLGIFIIAEGVETTRQLDRLRAEGCGEVQGFLFGKAVPADEVRRLILLDGLTALARQPA